MDMLTRKFLIQFFIFLTLLICEITRIEATTIAPKIITLQNCTKSELASIPRNENINEIKLNGCVVKDLKKQDFQELEQLTSLSFIFSELSTVEDQTFEGLKRLRILNLMQNRLTEVKNWTHAPLSALNTLNLSHNAIRQLSNDSLGNYINLRNLDLSYNLLSVLNEHAFAGLTYLRVLNLEHNQLKSIAEVSFMYLESLTTLGLHSNQVEELSSKAFTLHRKLRILNLANNKLKSLDFLPIENLQQLNLSRNLLAEINAKTFEASIELTVLDLSWNLLKSLEPDALKGLKSLECLDLSHNNLEVLPSVSFKDLKYLQYLSLAYNNLIHLAADIFTATKLLETINLQQNKLTTLPTEIFTPLPYLSVLNLASNQLIDINFSSHFADALERSQLSLDLSYNQLRAEDISTTYLDTFKFVVLNGNKWNCSWVIEQLLQVGTNIQFGQHYKLHAENWQQDLKKLTGITCFHQEEKRSIIILNSTYIPKANLAQNYETTHRDLSPSTPPLVWPKIYMDKFDSRSVIIWMLLAIAIAFAALRTARQFLEKKDRKARLLRKFRLQQSQSTELEVLHLASNASPRNPTSTAYQNLGPNAKVTSILR